MHHRVRRNDEFQAACLDVKSVRILINPPAVAKMDHLNRICLCLIKQTDAFMLTIHINKSATGLVDYFTNSLAKDDYFFSGKSIDGRWHGKLKGVLNLGSAVSKKAFSRLARGQHPKTGESLLSRKNEKRRTSIEYTFACPKSVSIIMALSPKEAGRKILNAHRLAVKKAMQEIERDMQTQTRIATKKTYAQTGNIIYARFDHFTARPVKDQTFDEAGYISDPHLHSHCVVMNLTKYAGHYQAIEGSTIHRVAGYYEAIYHAHLSKSLAELGYDIRRTENRYEINSPGMTRRTIEKFSRRTMEIESLAQEIALRNGGISAKTKGELGAKIRVNKSKVKENVDLIKAWKSRLTRLETKAIEQATKVNKPHLSGSAERSVEMAMRHHFERQSALPVKKLLAKALAQAYGQFSAPQIKAALYDRSDTIFAYKGYLEQMTTRQMVWAENQMIAYAASTKGSCPAIHPHYDIQRDFLNEQQRQAINQVLRSNDRVQLLSGAAGVGKSTLLVEIKEAAAQQNLKVLAFAPSSDASREVLRAKGFEQADTIASFLRKQQLQQQAQNQIILIDEASLVGVKTMNQIFAVSHKLNARVILSGDPQQHSSPEAGDAARILIEKARLKVARIDKVLRQQNQPKLKAVVEDLSRGQARTAYRKLDEMKAVVEIEDVNQRHQQLAHDYAEARQQGRSALVVCPTHKEGLVLTQSIRAAMKKRGRIQGAERKVTIQRNLSYTKAQKMDTAMYESGMNVQFHQHVKGGFKAGQRYEIKGLDENSGDIVLKGPKPAESLTLPLQAAEYFEVFQPEQIMLAKGDVIRITRNGRTQQGRRIYNGQVYEITGFNAQNDIQLKGGRTLNRDFGNLNYGFVQTSHAAQGKDADAVFIAQGSMSIPATNAKQFYVSVSRAKQTVKIYTDDKGLLGEAISRSGERTDAGEIAARQVRTRNRTHYQKTVLQNRNSYERGKQSITSAVPRKGKPASEPDKYLYE